MMIDIYLKVIYPVGNPSEFCVETNARDEAISELLTDFIYHQIGSGKDDSEANYLDVYEIEIGIDLMDDSWRIRHNCGNKGLRDGILMDVVRRIEETPERVKKGFDIDVEKINWKKDGF